MRSTPRRVVITGMDTERVSALAARMAIVAHEVGMLETRLTGALAATDWVGPDRTRFDVDWQGHQARLLRQAAADLHTASDIASENVREQNGASD